MTWLLIFMLLLLGSSPTPPRDTFHDLPFEDRIVVESDVEYVHWNIVQNAMNDELKPADATPVAGEPRDTQESPPGAIMTVTAPEIEGTYDMVVKVYAAPDQEKGWTNKEDYTETRTVRDFSQEKVEGWSI